MRAITACRSIENGAKLTTNLFRIQNAPFRSQIFKKIASCGKGALTPPNQNPADAAGHVRLLRELFGDY